MCQTAPSIRAAIGEGWGKVATERLGPAIREDAKRYCPVDTGALRDILTNWLGANKWSRGKWGDFYMVVRLAGTSKQIAKVRA